MNNLHNNIKFLNVIDIDESLQYLYNISIERDVDKSLIKKITLDVRNNNDAFHIFIMSRIDDESIIEVDGIKYEVIRCNIIDKNIYIYV